ncbi:hypothetical protein KIPB_004086 [Kipferlia bialata]|uniref:Uncharacterized protein n=1 Tax=Kipferlia bialata TaxID=797122 RepID=A0A9K3CUS4_9EUKA|nr:hypothetical protein KIPB_004086 [Kipferlia bialata]|eukprot:g4086.t1
MGYPIVMPKDGGTLRIGALVSVIGGYTGYDMGELVGADMAQQGYVLVKWDHNGSTSGMNATELEYVYPLTEETAWMEEEERGRLERERQNQLAAEWKNQEKERRSEEVAKWEREERERRAKGVAEWEREERERRIDEIAQWERAERERRAKVVAKWEREERERRDKVVAEWDREDRDGHKH